MERSSIGFASYMADKVSVKRWELFRLQFLVFFFMFMSISANADILGKPARLLVIPLMGSLLMCAAFYLSEQYRFRHEWMSVVFWFVLLVVALAIAWQGIEKHRQNERMNSNPTTIHP